ncbi:glycosyltransferase [Planococcus sp. N064]|uniref:Glycosyltransferase n=1 Tax=Planococcus liqunii TaxID=3058394 RepID=A0ABT8MNI1_9BACL|nr:glycosyltransferase [Planococcus sp. N064]MDN7226430.1 glycosyltransferase [Planococcus sp. N064]
MKKKKVVFLMTGLYFGGMERVAFIAHDLLKDIYDIKMVALYTKDANYKTDIEILDLGCPPKTNKVLKGFNLLKRTLAVKKMKKNIKPDITLSFGTAANFTNALTKNNDKAILGIRSYDWLTDFFINQNIDKWIYNKGDIVCSVSKVIADDAEHIFNINENKKRVLYNPYNVPYINKKSEIEIVEDSYDFSRKTFISVGRLVDQKGFNHLIKAFSLIVAEESNSNAQLLIIGQGEREELIRNLIMDLNLSNHVFLLGAKSNPYKFMKKADIYVLSSLSEGFPNAMVEAMALGLPILAVDCKSGPREILSLSNIQNEAIDIEMCEYGIITPKVSGSLNYNYLNIEECDYTLAKAMELYLNDMSLREKYSKESSVRAEEFTYDKFKANLIGIIDSFD